MRSLKWALLALCLLGITSSQLITRNDVVNEVAAGRMSWINTQPGGWVGSQLVVSRSDYLNNLRNSGACAGGSTSVLTYSQYLACAVTVVTHTPILANNTFAGGSFTSWTSTNTGGCSGSLFGASTSSDQDSDSGLATATSLSCTSTPAVVTLNQSFSTTNPPTAQTFSFYYRGSLVTAGDSSCSVGTGSVSLVFALNGTTIVTVNPFLDGGWHQVSGSTTALTNGANTLSITATIAGANGTYPKGVSQSCTGLSRATQSIQVDNISLSAIY